MINFSKYDHISTKEIEYDISYLEGVVREIRSQISHMEVFCYPLSVISATAETCIRYENLKKVLLKIIKYRKEQQL